MITIRRRGPNGDVEPILVCTIGRQPVSVRDAWLAFHPLSLTRPQSAAHVVHKGCSDGHLTEYFGTGQMALWRARDLFERLMRATD